ncbi:unnamed protein product [Caenorhabditis brenneri]
MSDNKSDSKELVKPDHQVKQVSGEKPNIPRGCTEFDHGRKDYSNHDKTAEYERDVEYHSYYFHYRK